MNANFRPNFKQDCQAKYAEYGMTIFNQAQRLFRRLPLATIVENRVGYRCFVAHGGISDRLDLNYIQNDLKRFGYASIISDGTKSSEQLSDMLWSDPVDPKKSAALGCRPNKNRGIGCLFSEDVSAQFCGKNGFNTIIRSHELRKNGYSHDHPNCYTIFSASNYCNGLNKAAVLILDGDKNYLKNYVFETNEFESSASNKAMVLKIFKEYLETRREVLLSKFSEFDLKKTGWIHLDKWAQLISEQVAEDHAKLNPKHLIALKDYLCPCDDYASGANYSKMLSGLNAKSDLYEFYHNAFSLIDLDNSGYITMQEAKQGIEFINRAMGTNYDINYFSKMDTNRDGLVDFEEFKRGFDETTSF